MGAETNSKLYKVLYTYVTVMYAYNLIRVMEWNYIYVRAYKLLLSNI